MTRNLATVLSKLPSARQRGENQYEARCPSHDDRRASLGIRVGDSGWVMLHCQAGCTRDAVLESLGLRLADIGPEREPPSRKPLNIVSTYDYRDEKGNLLFQVCRLEPKSFRRRRPDGKGGWAYDTRGVREVLYRLNELIASR